MGLLSTAVKNVMISLEIPYEKYFAVRDWCKKNISEQKYYLHHRCGGDGWELIGRKTIMIKDEKKALMMILTCLT
jgi:hypothetical protein